MSPPLLLRHLRIKCRPVPSPKLIVLPKSSSFKLPVRWISSTPCSYSRIPPVRTQSPLIAQQFEDTRDTEDHEDSQARTQRLLEESAAPVVVQDMEEFKDILVEHGSYETFMLMVLTRLQPILDYCLHHDPMEFLEGFAYSQSAVGRAREATIWLFISAHAWFTRAAAYNAPHLIPLSEDVLRLAELFEKAGIATEKFVEKKESDIPTWFEVGSMIIDCAHQAWEILPKDIDLYGEKYQENVPIEQPETAASTDVSRPASDTGSSGITDPSPAPTSKDPQGDAHQNPKGKSP